jgi:hypothetical protein
MGEETSDKKQCNKSKSKSVGDVAKWAAIALVIVGSIQPISRLFGFPIQAPLWMVEVLLGLGLYGVITALNH